MTTHCFDTSEAVELCPLRCLFLKPVAKIHISVQLPALKTTGKSISNWEVMEKVKATVKPDKFLSLKVVKSALEFVRLEGEVETRAQIQRLVSRLDGSSMKLSGYPEQLRVRAAEARHMFPARHDWDSYFRGGGGSDSSPDSRFTTSSDTQPASAGTAQRPDTVHIRDLPCKWFTAPHAGAPPAVLSVPPTIGVTPVADRPSADIVREVFETFGEIRAMDIPMLDPYREEIAAASAVRAPGSIATFSFSQELHFEVFVQYKEYISFVKALEALKGMRLLYKSPADGNAFTANIKVDFDKTNHMSEKAIRKRQHEREKLMRLEKEREEERKRQEREAEERRRQNAESASRRSSIDEDELQEKKRQLDLERKRQERDRVREERRARKRLERMQQAEQERLRREEAEERQAEEERRMREKARREAEEAAERERQLAEQRQGESIRLLNVLFHRIEKAKLAEEHERRERELREEMERRAEKERRRLEEERLRQDEEQQRRKAALEQQERDMRDKLLRKLREAEEKQQEERREELRRKISGQIRLRSTVAMRK